MATRDDARAIALALPDVTVGGDADDDELGCDFAVLGKGFAWTLREKVEGVKGRVLRPDVLAIRVDGNEEKLALIESDPGKFFTIPHYNNYPAVLARLAALETDELAELLADAWRLKAPKRLVREFDAPKP